mmetsp:Transcript_40946/g.122342  ORF Transcript_40946/g.122342 Transcript_40946/m.122342 type:complete len:160 (-) Transcript_40946:44-523(-)
MSPSYESSVLSPMWDASEATPRDVGRLMSPSYESSVLSAALNSSAGGGDKQTSARAASTGWFHWKRSKGAVPPESRAQGGSAQVAKLACAHTPAARWRAKSRMHGATTDLFHSAVPQWAEPVHTPAANGRVATRRSWSTSIFQRLRPGKAKVAPGSEEK